MCRNRHIPEMPATLSDRATISDSPIASLQGHLNFPPPCRIAGHDLNPVGKKLRILLQPASNIVTSQLPPTNSGEVSEIMIQI